MKHDDRRQYKRVQAPVYCRPAGLALRLFSGKQQPLDISAGGLRIFSDEPVKTGVRLELELFLPDNTTVTCRVECVWVEALPKDSAARFDVGLKFVDVKDEDRAKIALVIES